MWRDSHVFHCMPRVLGSDPTFAHPFLAPRRGSLPEAIALSPTAGGKRERSDPRRPCTALHNKINIDARRVSNDTKSPFSSTRRHWRTSSRELIRRREPLYFSVASQPNYRFSYARGLRWQRLKHFNVCREISARKNKSSSQTSYDMYMLRGSQKYRGYARSEGQMAASWP